MKDSRFDFLVDLPYGHEAERYVEQLVTGGAPFSVEVKRKRIPDWQFYIETYQNPLNRGTWVPSGISTTQATHQAFVISDTGLVIFAPTALLRDALQYGKPKETGGDNPTRGMLVHAQGIMHAASEQPF
jgi:hypothetical protein